MNKKHIENIQLLIATVCFVFTGSSWSFEQYLYTYQDVERKYLLHNEKSAETSPAPLVVVLHGFRREGQKVHGEDKLDNQLFVELDKLAEHEGFITLYPTTVRGRWNLFNSNDDKFILDSGQVVDDVGYIKELVNLMIDKNLADPSRIYLTGFSDGAILSYHLL